ncbi:MAG: hypothetical protein ACT4N4_13625 [Rhodospirillales bacterium]
MKKFAIALATLALTGLAALPALAQGKGCADEMKALKAAWDKAPAGAKKEAAGKEYKNAESALSKKDEKACLAAVEKAKTAMK